MSLRAAFASAFDVGMNAAQVHNGSAAAPRTMSGRGRDRQRPGVVAEKRLNTSPAPKRPAK